MNNNPTVDEIKQVKAHYQAQLLQLANVVGLGIGFKETDGHFTDQLALVVNVSKKVPLAELDSRHVVPAQLDGIPTDVQETGPIRAL